MLMGRTILPGENINWIDMVSLKKVSLVLKIIVSNPLLPSGKMVLPSVAFGDTIQPTKKDKITNNILG